MVAQLSTLSLQDMLKPRLAKVSSNKASLEKATGSDRFELPTRARQTSPARERLQDSPPTRERATTKPKYDQREERAAEDVRQKNTRAKRNDERAESKPRELQRDRKIDAPKEKHTTREPLREKPARESSAETTPPEEASSTERSAAENTSEANTQDEAACCDNMPQTTQAAANESILPAAAHQQAQQAEAEQLAQAEEAQKTLSAISAQESPAQDPALSALAAKTQQKTANAEENVSVAAAESNPEIEQALEQLEVSKDADLKNPDVSPKNKTVASFGEVLQQKLGTEGITIASSEIQGKQSTQTQLTLDGTALRTAGENKGASINNAHLIPVEIAANASRRNSTFDIRMDPPELGRLRVRLEFGAGGKVKGRLIVERPETLEALQKELPRLKEALQDAGFRFDQQSLDVSLAGHGNPQHQQQANQERSANDFFAQQGTQSPDDTLLSLQLQAVSRVHVAGSTQQLDVTV